MQQLDGLLTADECVRTLAGLEPVYAEARAAAQAGGGSDARFNRHSSSLRLGGVEGFDLMAWARACWAGQLRAATEAALGAAPRLNIDQCWLRRQFPPALAPPCHAPHGWHQDGALHADFSARPLPPPLTMLTVWIALTPCGDEAPSLQWALAAPSRLLAPAELATATLSQPLQHARLAAGDALVFDGALLHRTHVTPAMTAVRSSIELRFFPAGEPPARLRGERLLPLG